MCNVDNKDFKFLNIDFFMFFIIKGIDKTEL